MTQAIAKIQPCGTLGPGQGAVEGNVGDIELLFAFPDRVLRYDCAACDKPCCRGFGFGLDIGGPQRELLRQEPLCHLQARPWAGNVLYVGTLPSGCRMLDTAGR